MNFTQDSAVNTDNQCKQNRVDSHQHFWLRSRGDYFWLTPELKKIYSDFLPRDLEHLLKHHEITKTILVQAAMTEAETEFLLNIAAETDFVAGVVGWIDMEKPDAADRVSHFAHNPYFKGIRPMIQEIADEKWMLKSELDPAFNALLNLNLGFDALIKPNHLSNLNILIKRYPDLRIVIDHAAKPPISSGVLEKWQDELTEIAQNPNVYCKLSGLVTEAGEMPNTSRVNEVIDHVFNIFAPNKLMWGSDWPVLNLNSSYEQWFAIASAKIGELSSNSQEWIWGKTCESFYQI